MKNNAMKIRNGFVSNSSSSSFVVALSVLTDEEQRMILGYNSAVEESENEQDFWNIQKDTKRGVIRGFASMDNGDLEKYLGEELYSKCVCNHEG